MGRFIPAEKERRVRRLLRRRLTAREIARRVGVSHSTVAAVARRRRRLAGNVEFRQVRPYCCPRGHQVNIVPCVICLAVEARAVANGIRTYPDEPVR